MAISILKIKIKIIASIYLCLIFIGNIRAENNELILNPNKTVDLSNFKQISGIWNLVKISFPDAEIRFLYSSGKIDYCIFELKRENSFLVFSSKPDATSFNLKINDIDSNEFKPCIVRHTLRNSEEIHDRFFGYLFQLRGNERCEIISEGEYNEGNLKFNITRDNKGLWLGSVTKN